MKNLTGELLYVLVPVNRIHCMSVVVLANGEQMVSCESAEALRAPLGTVVTLERKKRLAVEPLKPALPTMREPVLLKPKNDKPVEEPKASDDKEKASSRRKRDDA